MFGFEGLNDKVDHICWGGVSTGRQVRVVSPDEGEGGVVDVAKGWDGGGGAETILEMGLGIVQAGGTMCVRDLA